MDPNRYNYITADSGLEVTDVRTYKEVDPTKIEYTPIVCNTLQDVQRYYQTAYPKLPDMLHHCMARMAIGKPINRNERRAMRRDIEKERKKLMLCREIGV